MINRKPPASQPAYRVKESRDGKLVTLETTSGIHVATVPRESAIRGGLIEDKPKRSGR